MTEHKCPICQKPNTDNWPLTFADGKIKSGGCQDCWEKQCSEEWWAMFAEREKKKAVGNIRFQQNARELFAAFAMHALLREPWPLKQIAARAYEVANTMIEAGEEKH